MQALKDKSKTHNSIIAEIKKSSPSKGVIRADFNPVDIAHNYQKGGAACLSILTDAPSFQGHEDYLKAVKKVVDLPILRKDFMYDTYQIFESRAIGADCILLIMASLENNQAIELEKTALELGMDILIECHDAEEVERALTYLKSDLIGINNRNLKTFDVSLDTSLTLSKMIPNHKLKVSESGIFTNQDICSLKQKNYRAFLIGESLMRQNNIEQAISHLVNDITH
jgi:indole-3-glycerol phosphate synthase